VRLHLRLVLLIVFTRNSTTSQLAERDNHERQSMSQMISVATRVAILTLLVSTISLASAFAQDDRTWSLETFETLSNRVVEYDETRLLSVPGSSTWVEATDGAIDSRRELAAYIQACIRNGSMPESLHADATAERLVLIQNIISYTTELGYCDQSRAALGLMGSAAESENPELRRAFEVATEQVESCVDGRTIYDDDSVALVDDGTAGTTGVVITDPGSTGRGQRTAGYVMLGVGAGALIGALAIDLANSGTRSDFVTLRDDCAQRPCSLTELADVRRLADDVDSAKGPIAALLISGSVLAVTGTVLVLTAPRGDRRGSQVSVAPLFSPSHAGVFVRIGGAR